MIELKFEYDSRVEDLNIKPKDKKYIDICLISNRGWTSDRVAEDIEWTKRCIAGTFEDEDGEIDFYVGFEGSPGIFYVRNGDRAYLESQYDEREDYLILELEELLSVLEQMYAFLVSIGK